MRVKKPSKYRWEIEYKINNDEDNIDFHSKQPFTNIFSFLTSQIVQLDYYPTDIEYLKIKTDNQCHFIGYEYLIDVKMFYGSQKEPIPFPNYIITVFDKIEYFAFFCYQYQPSLSEIDQEILKEEYETEELFRQNIVKRHK